MLSYFKFSYIFLLVYLVQHFSISFLNSTQDDSKTNEYQFTLQIHVHNIQVTNSACTVYSVYITCVYYHELKCSNGARLAANRYSMMLRILAML